MSLTRASPDLRTIGSVEDSTSFKLGFAPEGNFKKLYLHDTQANIDVIIGNRYNITDEEGPGQIVAMEVATDNPDLILECFVFGDNISVRRPVNQFTMYELLRLGRGLTPGDIELNPNGRGKDPHGTKDDQYPWISRWKVDSGFDETGSNKKYIVMRFTPTVYQPYRRLVVNLYNTSATDTARIHTLSLTRFYFEKVVGPDEGPPKRRNTGDTFQVERSPIREDAEYSEDLSYEFKTPANVLSGDDVEQVQEESSSDFEDETESQDKPESKEGWNDEF